MQTIIIQAYTLLVVASGLLAQLSNTPNATPELRAQIENTAQFAISYATNVINTPIVPEVPVSQTAQPEPIKAEVVTPDTCTIFATTTRNEAGILSGSAAWTSTTNGNIYWGLRYIAGVEKYSYSAKATSTGAIKNLAIGTNTYKAVKGVFGNAVCYSN